MNKSKVGIYAWAGPGTIRLLKTKYHSPKIDERSFLSAYDFHVLKKTKETFGVTDAWVTYSWGFSDTTEAEDYKFILSKLGNFKKLEIKTHAYIQGFNLVTNEFKNIDPWCRDFKGRLLPYSKGRSLTCPNNPEAQRILLDRATSACKEDFDGIFIDNIFFGLAPLSVHSDYLSFCGCSCVYCQKEFEKQYGYALSLREKRGKEVRDYLEFRVNSTGKLLEKAQHIAKAHKKEFGVNLYDPVSYTPDIYFGYSVSKIDKLLSYYLIENLSLPTQKNRNNSYFASFIHKAKKPVFIVSYEKGIGLDNEYTQKEVDSIFSEAKHLGYSPCLKTTEYKTKGRWHYLYADKYMSPAISTYSMKKIRLETKTLRNSRRHERILGRATSELYVPLSNMLWDRRFIFTFMNKTRVLPRSLKKHRKYSASFS